MGRFHYDKVKDPRFFEENRLPAHSDHVCYANRQELHEKESGYRISLDGIWRFHYARNFEQSIPGFEKEDFNCKTWDQIRVPAHIQLEGYDIPQYANIQYPWDGREEIWRDEIPVEFNPTASYVKYFTLPEGFLKNGLYISFQGVESGFALWLNGTYVGYSEDSFTPAEFELTPYVKEGENKLAVMVFKWTSSSWCEDQDFFRFSGIFRSVFLYTVPSVHIYDIRTEPLVSDNLQSADLLVALKVLGSGTVKVCLKENGNLLFEEINAVTGETDAGYTNLSLSKVIAYPKLWSAEEPYLYDLTIETFDGDGVSEEIIHQYVGFRLFEMKKGLMCLNGKRIVFKGVNRHEFSSKTGRVVSKDELLLDIVTMKRNNINAIRTCHYPDDSALYELCDIFGIYLIAENNLESHGSWDAAIKGKAPVESIVPGDNGDWAPMMLDRVNSCYQRDKNHPSILIWSCGNESYGGSVLFSMAEEFRRLDPHRLVHYEGIFNDRRYEGTSDMESRMYPSVEQIKDYLKEHPEKPLICCEYTHAMGNSCGAMHKYTQLADTEQGYQGGFIWDYIDQSLVKKDRYGKKFYAYGGDFGDRPTDYNFSGNGICYGGGRKASPKMQEVKFNYQSIDIEIGEREFTVKNKYLFLNTDRFQCKVSLEKEGVKVRKKQMLVVVFPLTSGTFQLPFEIPDDAEYVLTISFCLTKKCLWADAGYEIAFGQKVFCKAKPYVPSKKKIETVHGKINLGVKGEDFDCLFSSQYGGMVSYRYAGKEMLEKIPMPNFWRAPTDNDMGCLAPARYAQWKIASMYLSHRSGGMFEEVPMSVSETDYSVTVGFTYYFPTTPSAKCQVSYTVYGDGTVETKLTYDPATGLPDMPEFGMMFQLNADYDRLEWYGLGPAETYADRKRGAKLGVYKNKVADNMAGYLVPQECGNKTEVRYAKITDDRGRGMLFEGDGISFSALPYTPHEIENAMHSYELPQVHYTVVRAALAQMGVGGDDSWGAQVHPEYHIDTSQPLTFTFRFRGI